MDVAPLTSVRCLPPLLRFSNANRGSQAHALLRKNAYEDAANEFSRAAAGVHDPEAVRILELLEENHRQLARIVRSKEEEAATNAKSEEIPEDDPISNLPEAQGKEEAQQQARRLETRNDGGPLQNHDATAQTSAPLARPQPLKAPSALASNLASARGIPPQQQQTQKAQRQSAVATPPRDVTRTGVAADQPGVPIAKRTPYDHDRRPSRGSASQNPRTLTSGTTSLQAATTSTGDDDVQSPGEDPFAKFYSTFGGLLSKLSAPLAFAGLPLTTEDASPSTLQAKAHLDVAKRTSDSLAIKNRSDSSPGRADVNKIFSQATLRAVQDTHGPISNLDNAGNVNDSFYVVPTGGGTISYAGVVSRTDRQRIRRLSQSSAYDDDDGGEQFEDARESPGSPKAREHWNQDRPEMQQSRGKKTLEELEAENKSLKEIAANLSNRLYMWERSAQSQSMALHQSIRTLQPPPQPRTLASAAGANTSNAEGHEAVEARAKELEEKLQTAQREVEKYGRENEKLKSVVLRYRERWEKLKEGAKGRARRDSSEKVVQDASKADTP